MTKDQKPIGYLRYTGKAVESGVMDVRKSAEALLGFDKILRYFLIKEDNELQDVEFEIPVSINKGSWVINVIQFCTIVSGAKVISTYINETMKKAAHDGFSETGFAKDTNKIISSAIKAAQWIIKIAIHLRGFQKNISNASIILNKTETLVKIPNQAGTTIEIPKKYFDLYKSCPEKLFTENASLINENQDLELGLYEKNNSPAFITAKEKGFFVIENDSEVIFPELQHGQHVELKGNITRINERSNTIGFEYKNHILTCEPLNSHLDKFKEKIISKNANGFLNKEIQLCGIVDRYNSEGNFNEKKPKIIFQDIVTPVSEKEENLSLF